MNARLLVIASCCIESFYLWGFYAILRMFYSEKVPTQLQTAFVRHTNCVLTSLKLHSTNGIEKTTCWVVFFYNFQFTMESLLQTFCHQLLQLFVVQIKEENGSSVGWLSVEMPVVVGSSRQRYGSPLNESLI